MAAALNLVRPSEFAPTDTAKALWPDDRVTPLLIQRAAVAPHSTSDLGALASTAVSDFYGSLTGVSAASRLIGGGLRLTLDASGTITIPRRAVLPNASLGFVGEGDPMPARAFTLTGATLGPARKLASLIVFSRELAQRSAAEDAIIALLREDAGVSLDAAILSTAAATDDRPAGILNGLVALTPTAGGGDAARLGDLEKLAAAVFAGGGSSVAFIASPARAASIRLRAPDFAFDVWPSLAVAPATVIAIDPASFVSGFGPDADIRATIEAVVHQEDSSPLAIGTAGTPNTVAAPVRSLFQTDMIALSATVDAAWTLRTPAVSYVTSVTW